MTDLDQDALRAAIIACWEGLDLDRAPEVDAIARTAIEAYERAKLPAVSKSHEERARALADEWIPKDEAGLIAFEAGVKALARALAEAEQRGGQRMREKCAKMSDRAASNARYLGYEDAAIEFDNLAAAIRAGGKP